MRAILGTADAAELGTKTGYSCFALPSALMSSPPGGVPYAFTGPCSRWADAVLDRPPPITPTKMIGRREKYPRAHRSLRSWRLPGTSSFTG